MSSPEDGRIMALDVGERTVGIAVSDLGHVIANGVTTLRRASLAADLDALAELVAEHEVSAIVVGWPLRLNGKPGAQAFKVERFAKKVADRLGLPVEKWDERMTTVAAERALIEGGVRRARRRQVVDTVAATLILQSYLDAHG